MSYQIRRFRPEDLTRLKEITVEAFDGVSIDRNIETEFGVINGKDWRWRKSQHIQWDAQREPESIFVAEADDGAIVGYITAWTDKEGGIGNIPNLAVDQRHRGQGLGRQLILHALGYFRSLGLSHAKIETLDQNRIGQTLYPSLGFREVARQIHFVMDLNQD